MGFSFPQKVLFKHCDPAGIVFYPRYFEMINDAVETMFADALLWPFEEVVKTHGVPTAHFTIDFKAASRHGDPLILTLSVTQVGRSSLTLNVVATCASETRFEAKQTLVCTSDQGKPVAWPQPVKDRLIKMMETVQ